ncbi:MAG: GC-type dockerin domain-anchored protein [Phycisphaerales bacterium]
MKNVSFASPVAQALFTSIFLVATAGLARGQVTNLESLGSTGVPGNGWSQDARLAAGGSIVVFASSANNLVPGDTGGTDIFLRDHNTGGLQRISVRADGGQSLGAHWHPDVTPSGRFVVWSSDATSLLDSPTSGRQIFLRDRDSDGDGVFDQPGGVRVELISRSTAGTQANGACGMPSISADGRYVAFQSDASNLVPSDANANTDVFLRDRLTGSTLRISSTSGGASGQGLSNVAGISRNGTFVVFQSNAPDLISGDTNGTTDVFRYSILGGIIERVSESSAGLQLPVGSVLGSEAIVGACISADGRHVVFQTGSPNAVPGDTNDQIDVFVRDMISGAVTLISNRGDGDQTQYPSISPTISADGRFVLFATQDPLVVPGDTNRRQDVFRRDRDPDGNGVFDEAQPTAVRRVSVGSGGLQSTLSCYGGRVSDNGLQVVFTTTAGNLVPGDTNGFTDVFTTVLSSACAADWDLSGAVDGDDLIAFLGDWDAGNADADSSGVTDGDDVIAFFIRWDTGC